MNIGNAIKIFGAGGLKVTWGVPEKHIIYFFGLKTQFWGNRKILYRGLLNYKGCSILNNGSETVIVTKNRPKNRQRTHTSIG